MWKEFSDDLSRQSTLLVSPETLHEWSLNWFDSAKVMAKIKAEQVSLAEAHLARMRKLFLLLQEHKNYLSSFYIWSGVYYVAEAEQLLAKAKAG
jgi:hypothetical protein